VLHRLAYLALLIGLLLRLFIVLTKPHVLWIDDSFYSLGIARNIALGQGWTHDGLHVTNGFQPLFVFMMIPFYWILPRDGTLIPVLVLLGQAVLNSTTGWLLFRLTEQRLGSRSGLLVAVIWSFSPYIINGINALETPLSPLGMMLIVYLYLNRWRAKLSGNAPGRSAIELGVALGLLLLIRIDTVVFVGLLLLDLAYRLLNTRPRHGFMSLMATAVISGSFALAWFGLSYLNTGRLDFDSGTATRLRSIAAYDGPDIVYTHFAQLRTILASHTASPLFPWIDQNVVNLVLSLLLLLGVGIWGWWQAPYRRRQQWRWFGGDLAFFWLLIVLLPAAYITYQYTLWMWGRYFYPLTLPLLLLFAAAIEMGLTGVDARTRRPALANGLLGGVIVLYLILLPFSQPLYDNPIRGTPQDRDTAAQFAAVDWLQSNAESGTRAAAFQSGILAYFTDIPVVNLDGVVNHEALDFFIRGDILDYVATKEVTYLLDWRFFTQVLDFSRLTTHHVQLVETFPAIDNGTGIDHTVDLYQLTPID
jgi:hypothetical protein